MKSRRSIFFIFIGLIIGISCSFGIFSIIQSGKNIQQHSSPVIRQESQVTLTTASEPVLTPARKLKPEAIPDEEEDEYYHIENNSRAYDSLLAINRQEELQETVNTYPGNVNVLQEEMIAIREIPLINKKVNKKTSRTDTVITSRMNLKEDVVPSAYTLEIWRSPLNSFGYRMGKNKLALYGIAPREELLLYLTDEATYLKSGNLYYLVEKSTEFRNLRPVNDTAVIRKLEN